MKYVVVIPIMILSVCMSLYAAEERKRVPIKYVSQYYPPADKLSIEYPRFLMSKPVRMEVERRRLISFLKLYGLQEQIMTSREEQKAASKKPKKKSVKPKKWVWGFYFEKEGNSLPLVNVNGRFIAVSKLFPGRATKVLKANEDRLFLSVSGRVYKIEVGKPLPF